MEKTFLKICTDDEADKFWLIANDWWHRCGRLYFSDAKSVAMSAVAEFSANMQGMTLYPGRNNVK